MLAAQLVRHQARVWVDRWELNVGDSIVERVQSAIQEASALIVVLSKASVQSQWCKKELSAGLVRELEERRVVVLPVLVEDCDIPIFLRDKLYADFRTSFDEGLKVTLEAVAKVTSETLGRLGTRDHYVDWSIDWGLEDEQWVLRVTLVEAGVDAPYSILSEIVVRGNREATRRQEEYARRGLAGFGRIVVITAFAEMAARGKLFLALKDSFPQTTEATLHDHRTGIAYDMLISARRLGEDTGKDIVLDCAGQLEGVLRSILANQRPFTEEEQAVLAELIRSRTELGE